jgi:hypoxia up-regulated 1
VEIITKTKVTPHTYTLSRIDRIYEHNLQLNATQKRDAKKRLNFYDKKDEDKLKTDEAKNNFESTMYSFRDWLQTEENVPFVGEERSEQILKEIMDHLEWLDYGDGDDASFEEYDKRYKDLQKEHLSLKERIDEF